MGRKRVLRPDLGTCLDCGEVPYSTSPCQSCRRMVNRDHKARQNTKMGKERALLELAQHLGATESEAHALGLTVLVAAMQDDTVPIYLRVQAAKHVTSQGWDVGSAKGTITDILKLAEGEQQAS